MGHITKKNRKFLVNVLFFVAKEIQTLVHMDALLPPSMFCLLDKIRQKLLNQFNFAAALFSFSKGSYWALVEVRICSTECHYCILFYSIVPICATGTHCYFTKVILNIVISKWGEGFVGFGKPQGPFGWASLGLKKLKRHFSRCSC